LQEYRVIAERCQASIIVRRSEFIAQAAPVEDEEEAWQFVEEIRERHREATHNVYAWRVGLADELIRSSDDGEPAGTAGRPVLEVIQREALHNVVVVVTRYFGGILLGAGGLVRAYSKAATEVLRVAPKALCQPRQRLRIRLDYGALGKLQNEIIQIGGAIEEADYGAVVVLDVLLPRTAVDFISQTALDLTRGEARIEQLGIEYVMVTGVDEKK
jgi:uncharacterized YigZ family protein